MNAERLSLIIRAIRDDINKTGLLTHLNNLISSLNDQISAPNEENQKKLSEHRKAVFDAIKKSEFSRFPRTWRPILEEMGIDQVLGESLRREIEKNLDVNQAILVDAREKITELRDQISNYNEAYQKIIEGFDFLEIAEKGPQPGEAELSILMPRDEFDSELGRFAREVITFDKAIKCFSELTTRSREAPQIKQLSTTDPVLVVMAGVPVVLALLKVTDKVLGVIERTIKLKQAKAIAEEAGARAKVTKALSEEAQSQIESGLVDIEAWLFQEFKPPKAREPELKIEVKKVLLDLATRIDHGYQIDGDAEAPEIPEPTEGEEPDPKIQKQIDEAQEVKQVAQRVRYVDAPEEPVLELSPPNEDEDPIPENGEG